MTERITAAAIQYDGVTISLPKPARHGQVLRCAEQFLPKGAIHYVCQGFLTSKGRFVNRVQAMQIAWVAGQIPNGTTCQRDLYSEDIW
jgi:hypothetical protein